METLRGRKGMDFKVAPSDLGHEGVVAREVGEAVEKADGRAQNEVGDEVLDDFRLGRERIKLTAPFVRENIGEDFVVDF